MQIAEIASHEQSFVDADNGRSQCRGLVRNNKGQFRVREISPYRRDGRRGQNQIADAFELNEEDVQELSEL